MREKETLIGTIRVDSGILLLVDGVFDNIGISATSKTRIELPNPEDNGVMLNVFKAEQNGQQFLIIPLSTAKPITYNTEDYVVIDGVEEEEEEESKEPPEEPSDASE
jgi:hypothetical protein